MGETAEQPSIRFGRYSDSYKEADNYQAWSEALQRFESGDYAGCITAFLTYLRDEEEKNVRWQQEGEELIFEFYQGSKRVIGRADGHSLRIEAPVAGLGKDRPPLLQRLAEQNYQLRYGRYALNEDNQITLVFDTAIEDASPYKLYYGFREIALQADKQDDLLIEEFRHLEPVNTGHLQPLPEAEKLIKYRYITGRIEDVLQRLEEGRPAPDQHPGAVAYLLLDLIYRLDYLTNPEGATMETLERAHRRYFSPEGKNGTREKNRQLMYELQQLARRPREAYFQEMYRGRSTFGITVQVTHDRLALLIDNELHNMDWYQQHDMPEVALAVPGYIIGYSLFNYAMPLPDRDLLHLYYRIMEEDYFRSLGFRQQFFDRSRDKLNRRAIRTAIGQIAERHQARYPHLRPATASLKFDNVVNFARSYLRMIHSLNLTKI